jgi:hypothetical protein
LKAGLGEGVGASRGYGGLTAGTDFNGGLKAGLGEGVGRNGGYGENADSPLA